MKHCYVNRDGERDMHDLDDRDLSRREFLILGAVSAAATTVPSVAVAKAEAPVTEPSVTSKVAFDVNGKPYELKLDTRTTLLDALREHLHLAGTKKGCD